MVICLFFFFKQKTAYEMLRSLVGSEMCIRDRFDVVIYKSIRFAEASVANQAIVEYAGRHKGAEAYNKLARAIAGEPTSS